MISTARLVTQMISGGVCCSPPDPGAQQPSRKSQGSDQVIQRYGARARGKNLTPMASALLPLWAFRGKRAFGYFHPIEHHHSRLE